MRPGCAGGQLCFPRGTSRTWSWDSQRGRRISTRFPRGQSPTAVQLILQIRYGSRMVDCSQHSRAGLLSAAEAVRARLPSTPRLGLVLGSGLGRLATRLENPTSIPYSEIPNMPKPSVAGHSGRLTFGGLGGVSTACLEGRVHLYEGHEPQDVV